MKQLLVEIICGILVLIAMFPSCVQSLGTEGKTIYVDDDNIEGPWDGSHDHPFQHINDALNTVIEGDAVFVYEGIYYEQLTIDTSILLQGEEKNLTIIDGNRTNGDTVIVSADRVAITGFTIQHSGVQPGDSGIKLRSNSNTICNNTVRENGWRRYYYKQGGLYLDESNNNCIFNNTFTENRETGIYLHHATNNTIRGNLIYGNSALGIISNASSHNEFLQNDIQGNFCGMTFWPESTYNTLQYNHVHDHPGCGIAFKASSNHNVISHNRLINNLEWGIMLGFGPTTHNTIEYNTIQGTTGGAQNWFDGSGLVFSIAFFNTIRYNNFIGNKNDVYLENSLCNQWNYNYWEDYTGSGIKIIKGHFAKPYVFHPEVTLPWFAIDWHPSLTPHDIG